MDRLLEAPRSEMRTPARLRRGMSLPKALDFFAGSGLASLGLQDCFEVVWANDICPKKVLSYQANHRNGSVCLDSVRNVRGGSIPAATLSWASFPCQDLSLAGKLGGLKNTRSGLVGEWLRVLDEMPRRPGVLVAENVVGLLTANSGAHYIAVHEELEKRGYKVGCLVLDGLLWVPQSRPRVFVIAVDRQADTSRFELRLPDWCHTPAVMRVASACKSFYWWRLPRPDANAIALEDIIDADAPAQSGLQSKANLALLSDRHRNLLRESIARGRWVFPGYKRTRNGRQYLELRFDGVAGCLRTPSGGSSRQLLVMKRGRSLVTRLLTLREAARLMGVPDEYKLVGSYNDGYQAMGDAVVVPAVRHLAQNLLSGLAKAVDQ